LSRHAERRKEKDEGASRVASGTAVLWGFWHAAVLMTTVVLGLRRTVRPVQRFAAVGVLGAAVNMIGLQALYGLAHLPLLLASPLSAGLAMVNNYVLNERWTFGRRPSMVRFAMFNLSSIVALLVNVVLVSVLVAFGTHYLLADLVGIAAGAAWSFGARASWVWVGGKA
jgi:putative flippase GtrA